MNMRLLTNVRTQTFAGISVKRNIIHKIFQAQLAQNLLNTSSRNILKMMSTME